MSVPGSLVHTVMLGVQVAGAITVGMALRMVLWLEAVGGKYQVLFVVVMLCPATAYGINDGLAPVPLAPAGPWGIVKSKIAAPLVPTLVTLADDPDAPVVTVPT